MGRPYGGRLIQSVEKRATPTSHIAPPPDTFFNRTAA